MVPAEDRRTMLIALAGATVISFAPFLYIRSDTDPLTGAFYRMLYALPLLGLLVWTSKKEDPRNTIHAGLHLAPESYWLSISQDITAPSITSAVELQH